MERLCPWCERRWRKGAIGGVGWGLDAPHLPRLRLLHASLQRVCIIVVVCVIEFFVGHHGPNRETKIDHVDDPERRISTTSIGNLTVGHHLQHV